MVIAPESWSMRRCRIGYVSQQNRVRHAEVNFSDATCNMCPSNTGNTRLFCVLGFRTRASTVTCRSPSSIEPPLLAKLTGHRESIPRISCPWLFQIPSTIHRPVFNATVRLPVGAMTSKHLDEGGNGEFTVVKVSARNIRIVFRVSWARYQLQPRLLHARYC